MAGLLALVCRHAFRQKRLAHTVQSYALLYLKHISAVAHPPVNHAEPFDTTGCK